MEAAGRWFRVCFLVLFPVTVSSAQCVNYGHKEICGLKGSSVEFPCSIPRHVKIISIQGWSQQWQPELKPIPLVKLPTYKVRMSYLGRNGNCTMKLANLTTEDASIYYFIYRFRNAAGNKMKCDGIPGVRLHVLASPVDIVVEERIGGQKTFVTDWTVIEGQGITLTCIYTCAANLNSNPGYIWYKDRRQLNSSQINSPYLSLHPVRMLDVGSYVCALISYKDLPSSAVNLRVQTRPRNTMSGENHDSGSKSDGPPTPRKPKDTSLFPIPAVLIASVSFGLVIVITVVMLSLKMKRKKRKKRKRRAGSIPATPNSNSHIYMALDINSMSPDYDMLTTVRRSLENDYENLPEISSR